MDKIKILLDTDIGSDIDDALSLSYLLAHPRAELMGITTVSGQSEKRAELAHQICLSAGFPTMPIFAGASHPLHGPQRQPHAQLSGSISDKSATNSFPQGKAVEFLADTIRRNPGEITLLCIGPLTNIALLFLIYPDTPKLLKQIVTMCGVFHYTLPGLENFEAEWNASVDPVATAIVYNSPVKLHRSVGLDVTCQVFMDKQKALQIFDTPSLQCIIPLLHGFTYHNSIFFHDPLATVSVLEPQTCSFVKGKVEIAGPSHPSPGKTMWNPHTDGAHEVASFVDTDLFFKKFFGTLGCSFN